MSATAGRILSRLAAFGARLERDGDRLVVAAGDRRVPAHLVEQARAEKSALLRLLSSTDSATKVLKSREGAHAETLSTLGEDEHLRRGLEAGLKPEVPARSESKCTTAHETAVSTWPASAWQRLYQARLEFWTLPRRDIYGEKFGTISRHLNSKALAWSDMQNHWHKRHGERPAAGICAGCGAPIGDEDALQLDGYQVHRARDPDCLVISGKKWRSAADLALKALGLAPPTEDK